MKQYKVKPSVTPVTSITVEGKPHHFFHSKVLGRVRAVMIEDSENLPVPFDLTAQGLDFVQKTPKKAEKTPSKGNLLELLMDCNDRLAFRFAVAWKNYQNASDTDSKAYWLQKATRIQGAMSHLSKKMSNLLSHDSQ